MLSAPRNNCLSRRLGWMAGMALAVMSNAIAESASAIPVACPLVIGPTSGRPGVANVPALTANADAIIVGQLKWVASVDYSIIIDRVILDKSNGTGGIQAGRSIPFHECLASANYGILFLKAGPGGNWRILNYWAVGLPALPRAPARHIRTDPVAKIVDELANTLTSSEPEAEDNSRGLTVDFIRGVWGLPAAPDGDPYGKSVVAAVTASVRVDKGYSNVADNLRSIGENALSARRVEDALSHAKTDVARIWAGLILLQLGDPSKADPALALLMTPCLDHPLLVQSFDHARDPATLKYILPLAKSQNVAVRRSVSQRVWSRISARDDTPETPVSPDIVATAVFELEHDTDRGIRATALRGLCDIIDDCEERMGLPANAHVDTIFQRPDAIAKLVAAAAARPSSPPH